MPYATTDLREKPKSAQPGDDSDSTYMKLMRDRFDAARVGWDTVRKDFREDLRFVCGDPSKQWDPQVKSNRDDDGIPALTMDRLNPLVHSIVNQSRTNRPQPKVEAADNGDPKVAEEIEGKMRHVLYVSHAEVAFDCAEAYCASGGWGFYKIVKDYTSKRSLNQEPRVQRISDPMSEFPDPGVEQPDFSDAEYWFSRKKYRRADYEAEFGQEPQAFPFPDDLYGNWTDGDEYVWVAEYWWIEKRKLELFQLADGTTVYSDEAEDIPEEEIVQRRPLTERIVHCDIVDGARKLESNIWEGEWIPRFVVTGPERIYEGKRRYVSAVRYARDPQAFLNVTMSGTADRLATVNPAPFLGPKGAFKDRKWRDGKRHFYLEYEPKDLQNQPIVPGAVQRAQYEANIQATTQASLQAIDAIKGAVGYVDTVTQPTQADLSGIAVKRRENQASMANMQYPDSLLQSMWHLGRALVDLLIALTDTPRIWRTQKEDGRQKSVPVTMDVEDGTSPFVPGYGPDQHIKIDEGDYGVVVYTGPSYATKNEEEADFLEALFSKNPQLFTIYGDLYFHKRGWQDFEERAKMTLPPQLQQALQSQEDGADPQVLASQAMALQAENQQLKQVLQQVSQIVKTKQIEQQGKMAVQNAKTAGTLEAEKLKTIRALIETQQEQAHDSAKTMLSAHTSAIKHLTGLMSKPEEEPAPVGAGGQVQ